MSTGSGLLSPRGKSRFTSTQLSRSHSSPLDPAFFTASWTAWADCFVGERMRSFTCCDGACFCPGFDLSAAPSLLAAAGSLNILAASANSSNFSMAAVFHTCNKTRLRPPTWRKVVNFRARGGAPGVRYLLYAGRRQIGAGRDEGVHKPRLGRQLPGGSR